MKKLVLAIAVSVVALPWAQAWATPAVTGATGTFSNGQQVTISGDGFGTNGPNIELFDDFSAGQSGSDVPLTSPKVGIWSGYNDANHPILYSSDSHSPPYSNQIYRNSRSAILIKDFGKNVTQVFMSWWVRIPDGTSFPYYTSTPPGVFSDGSNWKFSWLMSGAKGYDGSGYDLCVPSYTYKELLRIAGNSYTPDVRWNATEWWSWTHWMRMTAWLKANETNPAANGTFYWQAFAEGQHNLSDEVVTNKPVFQSSSGSWDRINFPGWVRENATNVRPLYDDIYIAAGPNAAARVEIGDNPVYADCGNLQLLTPDSWSNGKVVATVRQGSFQGGQTAYVFVFDANNSGNTTKGFKVTIGGTSTSPPPTPVPDPVPVPDPTPTPTPPSPPQNLRIVQ